MMNYTVTINPTKRSVTVEYEGYKGTARCCPDDTFNLTDGLDEGYDEGYYDALNEHDECKDYDKYSDAMRRIVEILDEVDAID